MMHISSLTIYPIKACGGVMPSRAELVRTGLRYDRRWMLVDSTGRFVSQRQVSDLALVGTAIDGGELVVFAAGHAELRLPLVYAAGAVQAVQIWNAAVAALTHVEGGAWFSRFLGSQVSLVHMTDAVERGIDPTYAAATDIVSFADEYPLLVISEASLADLNRRLAAPIPMNRFRPNIVVAGAAPYAEETWARFRIGAVSFRGAKPCARCVVTTIDQQTGKGGVEPLKTLASYKRGANGKALFGMNVLHDGLGTIAVGDTVTDLTGT